MGGEYCNKTHTEPTDTKVPRNVTKVSKDFQEFWKNVVFGGISGILGVSSVYPIDVVKTQLQNQTSGSRCALATAKKILRTGGFLGFYKGLPPQALGIGPEKAIVMSVRESVLSSLGEQINPSPFNQFLAGIGAGIVQCSVSNPVEVVKVRAQVSVEAVEFLPLIRSLGFHGLFRGYSACMGRDLAFGGIFFPLYEELRVRLSQLIGAEPTKPPMIISFVAGVVAGVPAASLSTPFDVIKTRMQASPKGSFTATATFRQVTRKVLALEGPKALFAGMGPRIFRLSPQFGVVLLSFEYLKRMFA
jgi:solute carrier family 25 aspartate/glutamate transporter 12/13